MTYHDPVAELVVVGCAIHTPEGSRLAHQTVTVDDFYDAACARLFACTPNLPADWPDYHTDPWAPLLDDLRITAAAAAAGINEQQVRLVLHHRPVMYDLTGRYAQRVRAAAARRNVRHTLVEALQDLDDHDLDRFAGRLYTCLAGIDTISDAA